MRVLGVIPARLGSTRLPDKPLQLLAGEPLITRVIERVLEHRLVDRVVLATDSARVADAVKSSEVQVVMTDPSHSSGTDRVADVAGIREFREFDVVVNIQGDEPFLSREALVGTAAAPLDPALASDPSRVKVVFDARGRALYFSRAVIPHRRDRGVEPDALYWQHVGIYAFSRAAITRWPSLTPSPAEQAEQLEQLRALHHGLSIGVAQLQEVAFPGVDTPEDLRRAEAHWHAYQGQV
jgi:3-deoxy-manno-octulosonate cytidylyltransferase (CMP-KDO synthetase)